MEVKRIEKECISLALFGGGECLHSPFHINSIRDTVKGRTKSLKHEQFSNQTNIPCLYFRKLFPFSNQRFGPLLTTINGGEGRRLFPTT